MASGVFWASLWGPTGQPSPGGGLENAEIWDPPGRGLWTEAKKRETHYQTQQSRPKKSLKAPEIPPRPPRGPPEAPGGTPEAPGGPPRPAGGPRSLRGAAHRENEGTRGPRKPPEAPEAPGRFRSSEGHERKSPQPFRKILKGYRSARDKTLDRSQADKGGVGI